MYPGGYTAEVTSLSPKATEEDVYDFFANFGAIEHVEIVRYNSSPLLLVAENKPIYWFNLYLPYGSLVMSIPWTFVQAVWKQSKAAMLLCDFKLI